MNTGIIPEFVLPYDEDLTPDENLNALYEYILEHKDNDLDESLLEYQSPETERDSQIIRNIYRKVDGRKVNDKIFTDEEREVIDKYNLDVWGYKGDTRIVTPGKKDIVAPKWWENGLSNKHIDYADRATKIDDRTYAQMVADRGNGKTFQDKQRHIADLEARDKVARMQYALSDRRFAKKELDTLDDKYTKKIHDAATRFDTKIQDAKKSRDYAISKREDDLKSINDKIQALLDKKRSSVNEAMSPEDEADSAILRSIQNKLDMRRNARLTDEEKAILAKYDLYAENGYVKKHGANGAGFHYVMDNGSTIGKPEDKINYADRARKIDSREYAQNVRVNKRGSETFQKGQRRLDSERMGRDVDTMKDLLMDRKYYKDSIKWSEENYNNEKEKALKDFNQSIETINKWLPDAKERNQKRLDKAQQTIDNLLVKESYTNTDEWRVIPTGLTGDINHDILNSVIGQMSDGMWENSPGMTGYWTFANIDDNNNILVNKAYGQYMGTRLNNPYVGMSEEDIKNFFANKIKAIAQQYLHDQNINPYREWNGSNTQKCSYLDYDKGVTIADAYAAYKALKK